MMLTTYIFEIQWKVGAFFKRARVCTHKRGHFLIQFEAINDHLHVHESWLQRISFDPIRFFLYYLPKLVTKWLNQFFFYFLYFRQEFYSDFYAVSPHVFTLNLPNCSRVSTLYVYYS